VGERTVHELAACDFLRDMHDELDRLVADAYGWPWPLTTEDIHGRLVALHARRVEEEILGDVHWLRPQYQVSRFAKRAEAADSSISMYLPGENITAVAAVRSWPDKRNRPTGRGRRRARADFGSRTTVRVDDQEQPPAP
jgi:hypothetical protein